MAYEIDREFHAAYERALAATQMRDRALRRLRYYSFPYAVRSVASVAGDVCEVGCYRGLLRRAGGRVAPRA
jgi:hypothetical protein